MNTSANPRVSSPNAPTLNSLGLYDLARWKPLNSDRFVEEMVAMTQDLQEELVVTTEHLDDGRIRIAYYADLVDRVTRKIENDVYLITISDPSDQRSRPMAFVRTDADLDLGGEVGKG